MKGKTKRFVALTRSRRGEKFETVKLHPIKQFLTIFDSRAEGIRLRGGLLFDDMPDLSGIAALRSMALSDWLRCKTRSALIAKVYAEQLAEGIIEGARVFDNLARRVSDTVVQAAERRVDKREQALLAEWVRLDKRRRKSKAAKARIAKIVRELEAMPERRADIDELGRESLQAVKRFGSDLPSGNMAMDIAARIMALGSASVLVRLRAYGRSQGKRRMIVAYMRISKGVKAWKMLSKEFQKVGWIARLITSALLRRARAFEVAYSSRGHRQAALDEKRHKISQAEFHRRVSELEYARFHLSRVVVDAIW